ncbi:protein mono-ADP-ribosyltransferase TIPARP-like [Branchiostoma floridae x Branchiostoma belcheri]
MQQKSMSSKSRTGAGGKFHHDERKLFHGTDPDIIKGICHQNFDFRLSGKNATLYGKGSYFAKKASYSHS